jgi:hypothetical protein
MGRRKSLELKVGDRVYCKAFGLGTVANVLSPVINTFPVEVEFDNILPGFRASKSGRFMVTGQYAVGGTNEERDIVEVENGAK